MDSLKDFGIASIFVLVCSVSILFFVLGYPALNNQVSVLASNPAFNQTATNLSILLGQYQTNQSIDINISTADEPTVDAQSLQLVSTVATSRNLMSRLTGSMSLLFTLVGNVFGLSGGQFSLIFMAILSIFGLVLLYYVVKLVRYGT
jgi:hypothetical protein